MILAYDLEKPFCPNDQDDICVQEVFSALLITFDMILRMNTAIFKQGTLINKRLEIIKNYQSK